MKNNEIIFQPKNQSEEKLITKLEEYKLDKYFLRENNKKWLNNQLNDLEEDLIEIIKNTKNYYPALLELCNLYKSYNFEQYRDLLDYSLKLYPNDEIFLILDAEYYYKTNNLSKAKELLLNLTFKKINSPYIFKLLGNIYLNSNEKQLAIETFYEYLKLLPNDFEIRKILIRLLFEKSDFLNALLELKKIPSNLINLEFKKIEAICYYYKEDYKTALKNFLILFKNNKNDVFALMFLGDIYLRFQKTYQAELYWQKALSVKSNSLEDNAYLAKIYLFMNNYNKSKELISQNLENISNHYLSIFVLGLINLCENKFDDAFLAWNKVYNEMKNTFCFEFELIKKTLKNEKIKEFLDYFKNDETKKNIELFEYIKGRCNL